MSTTYEFAIPAEVRTCPACGEKLWSGGEIEVPGEFDIDAITFAVQTEIARGMEMTIIEHYQSRHRLRYWLFMRTRWKRWLW